MVPFVRRLGVSLVLFALITYAVGGREVLQIVSGPNIMPADYVRSLISGASLDFVEMPVVKPDVIASNKFFPSPSPMPVWFVFGLAGFLLYIFGQKRGEAPTASTSDEARSLNPPRKVRYVASTPRSEFRMAIMPARQAFLGIALFSCISNVLLLTASFYMMQIYDRVLPSRSVPTLIALSVLAAFLFAFQGAIDLIRGRLLVRLAASLDESLSTRIYDCIVQLPLRKANLSDGLQPLRDLDGVRSFLSGLGPTVLFDMPWMPLYLGIIFAFHPVLGLAALAGAVVLVILTVFTEIRTRAPTQVATSHGISRNGLAETSRRNAEVLVAMGMAPPMRNRWSEANQNYMTGQKGLSDLAGGLGAISKVVRMMLQSGVLGLGAYLVIHEEASAGVIIASSILTARALAPVDLAIAHWRAFVAARQSWRRLTKLLALLPPPVQPMQLPRPRHNLAVKNASVAPPGAAGAVVTDVSFALKAGQGLGVIGPSASGKSSLARMLVGVWQPARGKVSIDGASLDQWDTAALGRHVGYLPQNVEFFAGTVAENISRFDVNANPENILAAAHAAGVHDLIVSLPNGYETDIGEQGYVLSAGQQQRIALARALYGDPFLIVLDEPNSNLDAEGEASLARAILGVRARGGIVVVVAHRSSAIAGVDTLLVMADGRVQAFGPKEEVLAKMVRPAAPPKPFKVFSEAGR
jgi:ATP-binding cassette subfamily C protein